MFDEQQQSKMKVNSQLKKNIKNEGLTRYYTQ